MGIISETKTLTGNPSLTVQEIMDFLLDIPPDARDKPVHISSVRYNHPMDRGEDKLSVTYRVEK